LKGHKGQIEVVLSLVVSGENPTGRAVSHRFVRAGASGVLMLLPLAGISSCGVDVDGQMYVFSRV
jgi:hypothetical protein